MRRSVSCIAYCASLLALLSAPSTAATDIGKTVVVVRTVTGTLETAERRLTINDRVSQNEVIATAPDAASKIEFIDGTNISLGPHARVTLDKFVYDPNPTRGAFLLTIAEGVFRFVSGTLAHQAYSIETPNGTIGVRGTTFACYVNDGFTSCKGEVGHFLLTSLDGKVTDVGPGQTVTVFGASGGTQPGGGPGGLRGADIDSARDSAIAQMDTSISWQAASLNSVGPGGVNVTVNAPFQVVVRSVTASVSPTTLP
jgi:ferric-dicitrate binding protein FerR (iron transport regulator)